MSYNTAEERAERVQWFLEARFGLFVHFGLYAIPARGEWVRSEEKISVEDYQKYFDEFDPDEYRPTEWAKMASAAGMKYAVMTAKHHDGFCLFDSKYTDYSSVHTKAGRDLVREFVEAFRAEGIRVGLYYSLLDWHHEDFPAYEDIFHPMRGNEAYKGAEQNFDRYIEYMHAQVRELCENYGKLDVLWFDFSYGEMAGEKWQASRLIEMVRSLQPGIVIDNRLEAAGDSYGGIKSEAPSPISGDFASPEQIIPPQGVINTLGQSIPWEACITMNNHWGYCANDHEYKTSRQLIRKLVECVSKNGNLLLNVGPNAHGAFPAESVRLLSEIGHWMRANGGSIYGMGRADFDKPEWGCYTQRGNKLYAHIYEPAIGPTCLLGLNGRAEAIRLLSDGSELKPVRPWNTYEFPNDLFIGFGAIEHFTYPLPDEDDTVVEITLKG
jgi:alpha-L-fucosidase